MNDIKGIELFSTGEHHDYDFTEDDLSGMVDAYNELDFRPAISIGHYSYEEDSYGYLGSIVKSGNKLIGDLVDIDEDTYSKIFVKKYNRVSLEISENMTRAGKKYRFAITAVALLGKSLPAVANLAPLSGSFSSKTNSKHYSSKLLFQQEINMHDEEVKKMKLSFQAELAQSEANHKKAMQDAKDEFDKKQLSFSKENSTALEMALSRVTALESISKEKAADEFGNSCDIPALRSHFSALHSLVSGGNFKFSIDGKEKGQAEILTDVVAQINELSKSTFSTKTKSVNDKHNHDDPSTELHDKVIKEMSKSSSNYSVAMTSVLDADPALSARYASQGVL